MLKNKEDYKETSLYDVLDSVQKYKSVWSKTYKKMIEIPLAETEQALSVHNRLKNTFDILQGRWKVSKEEYYPLGYNIQPKVDITKWDYAELAKALEFLYSYRVKEIVVESSEKNKKTETETGNKAKKAEESTEKSDKKAKKYDRFKSELAYVNIEKYHKLLDCLIEKITNVSFSHAGETPPNDEKLATVDGDVDDMYEVFDALYNSYRTLLLAFKPEVDILEFYRKNLVEFVPDSLIKRVEKKQPKFYGLKKYYYSWLYIDLNCHYILQYVIASIRCDRVNAKTLITRLIEEVEKLVETECIEKVVLHPYSERDESGNIFFEDLFKHLSFYYIRDKFLEDIKVLKYIRACGERKNPESRYSLDEVYESERNVTIESLRPYFTEGKEVEPKTFVNHFKMAGEGIMFLNESSQRNIPRDVFSIKAVYREFFLDDSKYCGKRSQAIFSRFVRKGEISLPEYYFINEKINQGLFREHGLIDLFYMKNEFQEKLYLLVTIILAKLEPEKITASTDNFMKHLTKVLEEVKIDTCISVTETRVEYVEGIRKD